MCIYIVIIIGIGQYKKHIVITLLALSPGPSPHCPKPGLSEYGSSQVRVPQVSRWSPSLWWSRYLVWTGSILFQGYFGKGILSRARPDHSISDQWERKFTPTLCHHHLRSNQCSPCSQLVSLCYRTWRAVSTRRLTVQVSDITSCQLKQWHHILSDQRMTSHSLLSSCRYEELLRWAGSALSAQGLDEEAVSQTMVKLSQPVEMEEVRREGGGGVDGEEKEMPGPEGGVCCWSEVEQEAKRSCR